jgi:uncharacterized membrane protein YcaP (DUF421 family)
MNWADLFGVTLNPLEIIVRGTVVYWSLFLVFRIVLRRDVGAVGMADVLLLVLIADASQNAMSADYTTITEGLILVGTLVGWNWLIDFLTWRSARLAKLLEPAPLLLVHRGRILHRNLRREFLSVDDLKAKLRTKGVEHFAEVKSAWLESDGEVSVIPVRGRPPDGGTRRPV